MSDIRENLYKTNIATDPMDQNDSFKFAQLSETVKDAFSTELTNFFNKENSNYRSRLTTVPTVRKYSLGYDPPEREPESFLTLIQNHPDVLENLPAVAIGINQGNQKKLGIGTQFVDVVQPSPRLIGSQDLTNPVAISEGDILVWSTTPDGVSSMVSSISFTSSLFSNIASVTLDEIIHAIEIQSLYVVASKENNRLRLAPGKLGRQSPNRIEILADSSTSLLNTLGFSAGQSDDTDNPDRPPANRYQLSEDCSVVLDVVTEDQNQTREVADLVKYFLQLELDDRDFCFYGRSIFEEDVLGEYFQVILKDTLSYSSYEVARANVDRYEMLYGMRLSVPVTVIDYIDRKVVDPHSFIKRDLYNVAGPEIPAGDYLEPSPTGEKVSS